MHMNYVYLFLDLLLVLISGLAGSMGGDEN